MTSNKMGPIDRFVQVAAEEYCRLEGEPYTEQELADVWVTQRLGEFGFRMSARFGCWMAEFIKEHDAIDLLEKRIAQTNMATFLEENPGVYPPGLNSVTEYAISVRKPTK